MPVSSAGFHGQDWVNGLRLALSKEPSGNYAVKLLDRTIRKASGSRRMNVRIRTPGFGNGQRSTTTVTFRNRVDRPCKRNANSEVVSSGDAAHRMSSTSRAFIHNRGPLLRLQVERELLPAGKCPMRGEDIRRTSAWH